MSEKDVLNWNPISKKTKRIREKIHGVQGNLWSETITNINFMDTMINPRLIVLSQVAWTKKRRNWKEFKLSLNRSVEITNDIGWKNHVF